MQCDVCGLRSSVGYCEDCKKLLCEEHSIKCEKCAKTICPDHVQLTSSGRQLCSACYEARRATKSERRREGREGEAAAVAAGTGMDDLREEEPAIEQEALVGSVREAAAPWRLCIIAGALATIVALVVLVFPGLRRFDIGGGNAMSTPWVLMIIPVVAVFWGVVALMSFRYEDKRTISLAGIGLSVVAAILLVVAAQTDPARAAELEAQRAIEARENMTPEQLQQLRLEKLMRYSPQPQPQGQPQATPPADLGAVPAPPAGPQP